jgi:hypothetical protein
MRLEAMMMMMMVVISVTYLHLEATQFIIRQGANK